jgi:AraC-like DNA-binding protein
MTDRQDPRHQMARHRIIATTSVAEGQTVTSRLWSKHTSRVTGRRGYSSVISRMPVGRLWLCFVDCRVPMHVEAEGAPGKAIIYLPLAGSMKISARNEKLSAVTGGPALIPAATPLVFDATAIKCLLLEIPSTKLRAELSALGLGGHGVRPFAWHPSTAAAKGMTTLLRFALEEMSREDSDEDFPAYHRRLEALIMSCVARAVAEKMHAHIAAVPHIGRVSLESMTKWIRNQPGAGPDPAAMAAFAGLKPRALQVQFLKHFGTTPLAYVRDHRLEVARRYLRDLRREWSVTEVATRLGFDHLGRFAGAYRRKFGECPSVTHASRLESSRRTSAKKRT